MNNYEIPPHEKRVMEKALERLSPKKESSTALFVVMLILYISASVFVTVSARMQATVNVAGDVIPLYTFTGVFSSLSNICVIFMTVYCGKKGYFTSLILMVIQLPMLFIGIFVRHNVTSLPGVFGSILTISAMTIIYITNRKVKQSEDEIRRQAVTDMLTGLPNVYACTKMLIDLIEKKETFTNVTININGFKNLNDTMGFDIGNKVIMEAGLRWNEIAVSGQTGTRDFIAHLSGDEFALIIRGYKTQEEVVHTIEQYETALSSKLTVDGYDFYITASFGYSEYPTDADNVDALCTYSSTAMHELKRTNNSTHILRFTPDLLKKERTLEVERLIRDALENNTVYFHLQPQFDMSHKLRGFEALARMKDETGNNISPGEFIPVSEKVGLVDKIDGAVFRQAAVFFGKMLEKYGGDYILSINVSVRHLMKTDFLDEVREVLKISNVPPQQLEIEITESVMIDSVEKALRCIKGLGDMGVKLAIDDFGTGYSSLSYLHNFPADLLKIDKSFIDKMDTTDSSREYVAAIISIGHIMGFRVISEGVENPDQLDTLRNIGCDYVQGFIWGKPLSKPDVEELIASMKK